MPGLMPEPPKTTPNMGSVEDWPGELLGGSYSVPALPELYLGQLPYLPSCVQRAVLLQTSPQDEK